MDRVIVSELLDLLPVDHPGAIGSRRDLRRINGFMGSAAVLARELQRTAAFNPRGPMHLLDLGAGDGTLFLQLARRLAITLKEPEITLLDRHPSVQSATCQELESMGWRVHTVNADVFDWLNREGEPYAAVIANLFLHHFPDLKLRRLLALAAARTEAFIAFEPRRCRTALLFSRLVWVLGCNAITRHDAPVSVQAGFARQELSSLWPDARDWITAETRGGKFGHVFTARTERRANI